MRRHADPDLAAGLCAARRAATVLGAPCRRASMAGVSRTRPVGWSGRVGEPLTMRSVDDRSPGRPGRFERARVGSRGRGLRWLLTPVRRISSYRPPGAAVRRDPPRADRFGALPPPPRARRSALRRSTPIAAFRPRSCPVSRSRAAPERVSWCSRDAGAAPIGPRGDSPRSARRPRCSRLTSSRPPFDRLRSTPHCRLRERPPSSAPTRPACGPRIHRGAGRPSDRVERRTSCGVRGRPGDREALVDSRRTIGGPDLLEDASRARGPSRQGYRPRRRLRRRQATTS
jgi:hypothetical protein